MLHAIPVLGVCGAVLAGGPPPINDDCIASIPVLNGDTVFDNIGATTDGVPHALCAPGPEQIQSDVWFQYLPTFTGDITVSLCGSSFDTQLAVYSTAFCPAGDAILLACNDDACGLQSQVTVPVNPTAITLIRVGGVGGDQGTGTLSIFKTFPPGEECTSCRTPSLNVPIASTTAENRGTLDDTTCGLLDTVDEWWCWTAPESGSISVLLHGSSFSMSAAAFTGACDTLTELACVVDDDITGLPVQAGVTYRIRFAAEVFTTATYTWELVTDAAPSCPGDTNADGEVDVDDLNNVILDWGGDGSAHGGDLTGPLPGSPPDGIVNVNDLNAVIVGWGDCP